MFLWLCLHVVFAFGTGHHTLAVLLATTTVLIRVMILVRLLDGIDQPSVDYYFCQPAISLVGFCCALPIGAFCWWRVDPVCAVVVCLIYAMLHAYEAPYVEQKRDVDLPVSPTQVPQSARASKQASSQFRCQTSMLATLRESDLEREVGLRVSRRGGEKTTDEPSIPISFQSPRLSQLRARIRPRPSGSVNDPSAATVTGGWSSRVTSAVCAHGAATSVGLGSNDTIRTDTADIGPTPLAHARALEPHPHQRLRLAHGSNDVPRDNSQSAERFTDSAARPALVRLQTDAVLRGQGTPIPTPLIQSRMLDLPDQMVAAAPALIRSQTDAVLQDQGTPLPTPYVNARNICSGVTTASPSLHARASCVPSQEPPIRDGDTEGLPALVRAPVDLVLTNQGTPMPTPVVRPARLRGKDMQQPQCGQSSGEAVRPPLMRSQTDAVLKDQGTPAPTPPRRMRDTISDLHSDGASSIPVAGSPSCPLTPPAPQEGARAHAQASFYRVFGLSSLLQAESSASRQRVAAASCQAPSASGSLAPGRTIQSSFLSAASTSGLVSMALNCLLRFRRWLSGGREPVATNPPRDSVCLEGHHHPHAEQGTVEHAGHTADPAKESLDPLEDCSRFRLFTGARVGASCLLQVLLMAHAWPTAVGVSLYWSVVWSGKSYRIANTLSHLVRALHRYVPLLQLMPLRAYHCGLCGRAQHCHRTLSRSLSNWLVASMGCCSM